MRSVFPNVGPKKQLSNKLPDIVFTACICHERNLMACKVLMRPADIETKTTRGQFYRFSIIYQNRELVDKIL